MKDINKMENYSIEDIYRVVEEMLTDKFPDAKERMEIVDLMGQQIIREAFMQILFEAPDTQIGEGANIVRELIDKKDAIGLAKECQRIGIDVGKIFTDTASSVLKTVLSD